MSTSPTEPAAELDTALAPIRESLDAADGHERAVLLRRAGDLCVQMGEPRKALGWYGRAVDQYMEMGESAQAAGVCRQIIHVQPDAVRARCTLAWIALGDQKHAEAGRLLSEYVSAALRAGQMELAVQQLGWMFDATRSESTRARIVVGMLKLGATERAEALAAQFEGPLPASGDQAREELWARVLQAAVGVPMARPPAP
ncbi:MAG TPA: hypothetical protein VGB15_03855 [Longimicrobium sp.]